MNRHVRQVEEERFFLVRPNEAHRLLRVAFDDGALFLVGKQFEHLVVPQERQHAFAGYLRFALHVVRVRDAEVVIEALLRRQELRLVAQVPLADALGRIAQSLQAFGDGHLVGMQPLRPTR